MGPELAYSDRPDEPLTKGAATRITHSWIDEHLRKPLQPYAWSQMRWLMSQLGERCVAEALRLNENEDDLCQHLGAAYDVLHRAWDSAAPDYATRWRTDGEDALPLEERQKIDDARHILWKRHNVKLAFSEGTRSEHSPWIEKLRLQSTIADYLARPYLRHPILDWIFLDMLVSREIAGYGESLKQNWLPGKRDAFLGVHARYWQTQGNLAEMVKIDWNEAFGRWNVWFWFALALPIGSIWLAFKYGYQGLGTCLLLIYAGIIAAFLIVKTMKFMHRLVRRLCGRVEPRVRLFRLWDTMYEVWRTLEGPVVNPTRVRQAMAQSAREGAVWDNVAWSLIDRAGQSLEGGWDSGAGRNAILRGPRSKRPACHHPRTHAS